MSRLELQPVTLREARRFVQDHHRHHQSPQGGKFAIAVNDGSVVIGVVIVGRPVARLYDDGWTAEVTRCCVMEGHKNAASMLYSASWRAARAMGYHRLITYTLANEKGVSLVAAGAKCLGEIHGGKWGRQDRPRVDTHPTSAKTLWELGST